MEPKPILHPIDLLAPNWLAEPDGKLLDDQSPPLSRQKVPQLMDQDKKIEEKEYLQANEEKLQHTSNHIRETPSLAQKGKKSIWLGLSGRRGPA